MQVYYFAFVAFLSCVAAAPKERRSPYFFNPYSFAFGGFGRPFGGAFSQAGVGFPFYQPIPWVPFPMPDFSQFTEWYKGPNVCKVDKVIEEPDEIRQFMSEGGTSQGSFDFNHESESCRGDNDVYVCMKWIQTPKGTNIQMSKYSCCYGYTRATDGSPGCVEKDDAETTEEPKALPQKEQYRYKFYQGGSSTSAVGKVPAQ